MNGNEQRKYLTPIAWRSMSGFSGKQTDKILHIVREHGPGSISYLESIVEDQQKEERPLLKLNQIMG